MNLCTDNPWFGQRNLVGPVQTASNELPREVRIYLLVMFRVHPEVLPPEVLVYLAERCFGNCVGDSEHA